MYDESLAYGSRMYEESRIRSRSANSQVWAH